MFKTICFALLACLSFNAFAEERITVQMTNDTGRTTIARNITVEGGKLVYVGCYRFIPRTGKCNITVRKTAPTGKLTVDFEGVIKTATF